jgi:hypothetical protein
VEKEKPIIFLDIDGVLATVTQYNLSTSSKSWLRNYDVYPFDKKCVKVFNEILEKTDADIIISSDWRNYFSMDELCDIFTINGVIKTPVGSTPIYPTSMSNLCKNRSGEILEYVKENNITNWVAIDDIDLSHWLGDNFFRCKSEWEGIKQSGLKKRILNYLL